MEQVDRVSWLSVLAFQEKYFSRLPVIITDVMTDWNATKWTVQTLRDQFGGSKLPVRMDDTEFDSLCAATNDTLLHDLKEARRISFKGSSFWIVQLDSYFDAVLRGGSHIQHLPHVSNVPLLRPLMTSYLQALGIDAAEHWDPLISALEGLLADVAFPEYLTGKRDYRFWFTPGSRRRGILHADGYHNLNAQVRGRKEWTLSRSPVTEADLARDPAVAHEGRFSCATEKGEILYIPKSWWHAATAVGSCININAWHIPSE